MKKLRMGSATHGLALAVVCAAQLVAMCYIATLLSATPDEYPHLAAGLSYIESGRFDLYNVNPPPIKIIAALPAWYLGARCPQIDWALGRPEFDTGLQFARDFGITAEWCLIGGRWVCCVIAVCGTLVVYVATKSLLNRGSALIAAVLWASCPLVLAYGPLVSFDIASAVFGLASAWRVEQWINRQSFRNLWWASASMAAAIFVKFTWLIWVFLFPAIGVAVCLRYSLQSSSSRRPLAFRVIYHMALGGIIVLLLLNMAYLCQETCLPINDLHFHSAKLAKLQSFVAATPMVWPLPKPLMMGLDTQFKSLENIWPTLRFGREYDGGVWYFYLVGIALKCPLGALFLTLLGAYQSWQSCVSQNGKWWMRLKTLKASSYLMAALLPFILVSSEYNMNDHFRYCLFLLSFLSVAAGIGAWLLISRRAIMTLSLCLLSCFLPLLSFPYLHDHVNLLGKMLFSGVDVLGGSVADWQQGWWAARKWIRTQPESDILMFTSRFSDPSVHHLAGSSCEPPVVNTTPFYFLISTSDRIKNEVRVGRPYIYKLGGGVEVYELHELPPIDSASIFQLLPDQTRGKRGQVPNWHLRPDPFCPERRPPYSDQQQIVTTEDAESHRAVNREHHPERPPSP